MGLAFVCGGVEKAKEKEQRSSFRFVALVTWSVSCMQSPVSSERRLSRRCSSRSSGSALMPSSSSSPEPFRLSVWSCFSAVPRSRMEEIAEPSRVRLRRQGTMLPRSSTVCRLVSTTSSRELTVSRLRVPAMRYSFASVRVSAASSSISAANSISSMERAVAEGGGTGSSCSSCRRDRRSLSSIRLSSFPRGTRLLSVVVDDADSPGSI